MLGGDADGLCLEWFRGLDLGGPAEDELGGGSVLPGARRQSARKMPPTENKDKACARPTACARYTDCPALSPTFPLCRHDSMGRFLSGLEFLSVSFG